MYSGQQKSETSSSCTAPLPLELLRPKPWPRTCVLLRVFPSCGSPVLGFLAFASGGASVTFGCGFGRTFGSGSVIAGVLGAGGASTVFGASCGGGACTV